MHCGSLPSRILTLSPFLPLFFYFFHPTQKLKYPKQIGFIISNEFCERFNYYGMRSE